MRSARPTSLFLAFLAMTAPIAEAQPPGEDQLVRFQSRVRQDLTGPRNHTCVETIARSRRAPPAHDFRPLDTIRLEVSTVGGKELFAKPGGRFDEKEVGALGANGIVGSGMFSGLMQNLFLQGKGSFRYGRTENLAGHQAVRYDFRLTKQESSFKLQLFNASEIVAAKGSFWFDPDSLDLIRLEIHGKDMPYDLHLAEAVVGIDYARIRIGDSNTLLPRRSELTLTFLSGDVDRDLIDFSNCRAYRSDSTITFGAGELGHLPQTQELAASSPKKSEPSPTGEKVALPTAVDVPTPAEARTPPAVIAPPPDSALVDSPASPPPLPLNALPVSPVAAPPDQPVSFRADVNLVLVPVVVRDRKGDAIGGLLQQDFQLFDGGRPQEITHFLVQHNTGAGGDTYSPDAQANRAKAQEVPSTKQFVAYLFDDVDIRFEDLVSVRDAAWRYISQSTHQADLTAIVTASGKVLADFTNNRTKVHDALFQLRPNPLYRPAERQCPDVSYYQALQIDSGIGGGMDNRVAGGKATAATGPTAVAIRDLENCDPLFDPRTSKPDPVAEAMKVEAAARRVVDSREREVSAVLNSLGILAARMASLTGQRSIILVSPGLLITDALRPKQMRVIDQAVRGGVVVSALDALGLFALNPAGEIDETIPPGAAHPQVTGEKVPFRKADYEGGAQGLAAIAHGTGGRFIENTNDFARAYRQLANLPEFIYLLGFVPKDVKPDGSLHPLKVKLTYSEKYDVQARRGYLAPVDQTKSIK
jgi:VWFA-related protein